METTFHVPMWLLSNIGGLIGFGIFSLTCVRLVLAGRKSAELRRIAKKDRLRKEGLEKAAEQKERETELDRILPLPWRWLYDLLHHQKRATCAGILLSLTTFKRDVLGEDILGKSNGENSLSPVGFDMILGVTYYNIGEKGHCQQEAAALFESYVKFPEQSRV